MTRTWSPSAVLAARSCPQQWKLVYAESDPGKRAAARVDTPEHMRLGTAAHIGFDVAYTLAQGEADFDPGRRMSRYREPALDALEREWARQTLPEGGTLFDQVASEVAHALDVLPCPHPRAVLGVEQVVPMLGPHGTPFTNQLDLVLRTGPSSLHLRDWKRKAWSTLSRTLLLDDDQLASYRVAVSQRWPWARTVTVGLFSIPAAREHTSEPFPLELALDRVAGHELTAHRMETATSWPTTPDGSNCGSCRARKVCPEWSK
jgi:PD-(D/E)XK nuclease superfamily